VLDRWTWVHRAASIAGVLALVAAYLGIASSEDLPPFSESPTTTTATTTKPRIPVIAGEIGHLSTPPGLGDAEEGDVLQLELAARSFDISLPPPPSAVARGEQYDDPGCEQGSLGSAVCEVIWVDQCDEPPSDADLAQSSHMIPGCIYRTIRTVDEDGTGVPGWEYNDGVYELDGYYAVEDTGMQNDNIWLILRDVPVEDARQMDQ
jgi:hypothetical protein